MKKLVPTSAIFFLLILTSVFSQGNSIDSLKEVVRISKNDSLKVNTLNLLSKKYFSSDPEEAIRISMQARELAEKIKYMPGLALSLKNIGIGYYMQSSYLETFEYWNQSLAMYDSIGDKVGVSNIQNNIGSIYFDQGDDTKALEYYLKSLKAAEELSDTFRIATALGNIGNVYQNKEATLSKALLYYKHALPLSEAIQDSSLIGTMAVGIGEIYFRKNLYDSALTFFQKSLNAYTGTEAVPYSLNAIGKLYTKQKEYSSALDYHQQAYDLALRMDAKLDMIQSLLGLGRAHEANNDYSKAIEFLLQAEILSDTIGNKGDELKESYEGLANCFSKMQDYKKAFKYQLLLTDLNKEIYNAANDKKLANMQFDFDIQKKQGQIDLLTKDKALQDLDIQRQKGIRNVTIAGLLFVMLFLGVVMKQKKRITKEKKRSDELLLNILPEETAEELKATGTAKAKGFDLVTVLFTDFKNFTQASEKLSPAELVEEINYCYSEFDKIITRHGIEKIKTIGDSYMCAGGLPVTNSTHPQDVVMAGLEMQTFIIKHKADRISRNEPYFDLRCGIHTGPVVAGIVGIKKFAYDIWGDTVNTASRMESSGEIGKVNISGTTYELIKDKFDCTHRGMIEAKNKGQIEMYFVEKAK